MLLPSCLQLPAWVSQNLSALKKSKNCTGTVTDSASVSPWDCLLMPRQEEEVALRYWPSRSPLCVGIRTARWGKEPIAL